MTPDTRLQALRKEIAAERGHVGVKPYSHNIISLTLAIIAEEFGRAEANAAIRDLRLDALGWEVREDTDKEK